MARPQNANAHATRERILDAATRLFGQQGPDAVSMRQLAKAAGTTPATLHHYFGNKQGLVDACIARLYARVATLRPTSLEDALVQSWRMAWANRDAMRLVQRIVLNRGEDAIPQRSQSIAMLMAATPEFHRGHVYSLMLLVNRLALLSPTELDRYYPDVEGYLMDTARTLLQSKEPRST